MVRKLVVRGGVIAVTAAGVVIALGRDTPPARLVRRVGDDFGRRARHLRGQLRGVQYRVAGHHPDLDVSDDVLADRVRSSLGPLEKRLDIPHVHVMVEERVALLHGEAPTLEDAETIAEAVLDVPGIMAVESYVHVGLVRGDTRPSEGRHGEPSPALRRLLDAARDAGVTDRGARLAVRSVLGAFVDRLPAGELDHVLAHLPADVTAIAGPPRRTGKVPLRVRTVPQLVAAVTARGGVDPSHAEAITESVLGALRELVPEEARGIRAVLPSDLKKLWDSAVPV